MNEPRSVKSTFVGRMKAVGETVSSFAVPVREVDIDLHMRSIIVIATANSPDISDGMRILSRVLAEDRDTPTRPSRGERRDGRLARI